MCRLASTVRKHQELSTFVLRPGMGQSTDCAAPSVIYSLLGDNTEPGLMLRRNQRFSVETKPMLITAKLRLTAVMGLALLALVGTSAAAADALDGQLAKSARNWDEGLSFCVKGRCPVKHSSPELPSKSASLSRQLFKAIETGNSRRVGHLLSRGVGVDVTNERGMPPILFLFSKVPYPGTPQAQIEIARLLLSHGSDPNQLIPASVNDSRAPVLDWAIYASRSTELVRLFLELGADPNLQQAAPLFVAVQLGEKEIVELLIDSGADVNARGRAGQTPLFFVDNLEVAKTLVSHGADVNARNNDGISVLTYLSDPDKACGKCGCIPVNEEVIRYLESKGAK